MIQPNRTSSRWLRNLLMGAGLIIVVASIVYAMLPKPVGVDLAVVERGPLSVTVDEDGKTRIKERYVVSTPLAGRLVRIGLDVGDLVQAGKTVLTRIEPTDPELLDPRAQAQAQARVKAAEAKVQVVAADLQKAQAAMEYAESELSRMGQLHAKNSITKDQLEETELNNRVRTQEYRSARFSEEIATFELELARAALLRTKPKPASSTEDWYFEIRAPISGRVLRILQESETIVSAGAPLLELGDPTDLEVIVDVLSMDAVSIAPGNQVLLEQWGGAEPLLGTVRLVEPSGFTKVSALGVEEQRVNVVADFNEPPEKRPTLGDGFRVEARIVIWEESDVLKIPIGALFRSRDEWSVFALEDGAAELRSVSVGRKNGLQAEIRDGLNPGDRVIVHPSDRVADGVAVFGQ